MSPTILFYFIFIVVIALLLVLDLAVFHKHSGTESIKKSLLLSSFWISLALLFCIGVYWVRGGEAALKFLTGYIIELSLSVDNLFVFLMIFTYFHVPEHLIHKTLFWGIIGAIIMRAIFIVAGIVLVQKLSWVMYIFALFLIYTGIQLALRRDEKIDFEKNFFIILFKKFIPMTSTYEENFFTRKNGKLFATPLFLVLLTVEATDVIFAIDSIPAILGITQDPMIVFTSNIFAILGLRSMYFSLAKLLQYFKYLHYGLAVILIFVGIKMLLIEWVHVPIMLSLGFIISTLAVSILCSIFFYKEEQNNL